VSSASLMIALLSLCETINVMIAAAAAATRAQKSSPFTFAFSCLLAMGLIAGSGVFSRHAVYACRGRDDSSYYLFMLFSFLRGAKYLNETGFIGDEQRPSNSYCSP
jgi:hypothetical protein